MCVKGDARTSVLDVKMGVLIAYPSGDDKYEIISMNL